MATEYEIKFKATSDVLTAIDSHFPGPSEAVAMETTYYDTPSGSLSALRYTLRQRFENGKSLCTLKTPGDRARGEWETACGSITDAVPRLVALGCPANLQTLAQEGLLPICGAKFTRTVKTVVLPDGIVELALDCGHLTGGSREMAMCELEVELKSGEPSVCDHFAKQLAARFQLEPEKRSKFSRAFALYKGE